MNAIATSKNTHRQYPFLSEDEAAFLSLFTQDGPIRGAIHGPLLVDGKVEWKSAKSHWKLSPKKLIEFFQDPYYIVGKRFNTSTSYLVLDIDRGSQYHPTNDLTAWNQLLGILEDIGLVRPLIVRSSQSQGIHLYFPFDQALNSLQAAKILALSLRRAGLQLQNGQLEIFPNVRQRNSAFNGIRLPLQSGSYLLDTLTLEPTTNSVGVFVEQWQRAITGNDLQAFLQARYRRLNVLSCQQSNRQESSQSPQHINQLPPLAFTQRSQTNIRLREVCNWGIERLGIGNEKDLGDYVKATIQQLSGYDKYVSAESKCDIEQRDWCYRWAQSALKYHKSDRRRYRQQKQQQTDQSKSWNQIQHEHCMTRLRQILSVFQAEIEAGIRPDFASITSAISGINDYAKATMGKGFSKQTLYAHKTEIEAAIVRPLAQSEFNPPSPTVENNATRVYRLPHKDLNAVHPKSNTAKKPHISEEPEPPIANKTAVAGGAIAAKADGEPHRQPSKPSPEQFNTELTGSVEENAQSLTHRRSDMTKPVDELVQQRIKKDLATKNGTQAEIAERHGVSTSTVKRIAKSVRPVTQVAENISGAIAQGALGQGEVSELDYGQILTQIIIKLEESIAIAEPKSLEAVASCLMKALTLHREFMTTRQAVDWILDLPDFDPREFTRILKEEYGNRRARQST